MKTLQLALLALTFAASSTFAQDKPKHEKMKATKECGTCCKQGGDCCDKKKEAPKTSAAAIR